MVEFNIISVKYFNEVLSVKNQCLNILCNLSVS